MNQLRWGRFHSDIALLNVRWYLSSSLSYRNLMPVVISKLPSAGPQILF